MYFNVRINTALYFHVFNVCIWQLRELLEASVYDVSDHLNSSPLYTELRHLVTYLCKVKGSDAVTMEASVWTVIRDICIHDNAGQQYAFGRIETLLQTLSETDTSEWTTRQVYPLATDVAVMFYKTINENTAKSAIKPLCGLVKRYYGNELVRRLLGVESFDGTLTRTFVVKVLVPLLKSRDLETDVMETIVDVVVMAMSQLQGEELEKTLDTVLKVSQCQSLISLTDIQCIRFTFNNDIFHQSQCE